MDLDDLEPKKQHNKPRDLTGWNIEDLKAYIAKMKLEIKRAESMIEVKQKISLDGNLLFKS
jgi:activator of HSP90 ATPase